MGLFHQYKEAGQTKRALLVGQNMINRNPGDSGCFEAYFDYLLLLAGNEDVQTAKSFLQQATGALAFFSESVDIDEHSVELIINKENELNRVSEIINQKQEEIIREAVRQEVAYNNAALELLGQLLEKINKCKNQADFNTYLNNMDKIDQSINREKLSKGQEARYAKLTQKSSAIVSAKMAYFEDAKNREYNISAIEAYEKVFNMFKNGKLATGHKKVLKLLFSFDPSRLYNETLVYYNHVYNYVLSKLSDEEKFTITKYAIMCEKKR